MKRILVLSLFCALMGSCGRNDTYNRTTNSHQETIPDWEVTAKVKAAIMADTSIGASSRFVSVTTNNGVVTLTGNVNSREDRDKIVRIAKDVCGVSKVDNQLTISP